MERLISQLPSDPSKSRLVAAQMEDDELADLALASEDKNQRSSGPSIETWSTEVAYLAAAVDRLGEMISAVIVSAGGKAPKVTPLPRPKTAFDRASYRRAQARHHSLVAEVNAARARARRR